MRFPDFAKERDPLARLHVRKASHILTLSLLLAWSTAGHAQVRAAPLRVRVVIDEVRVASQPVVDPRPDTGPLVGNPNATCFGGPCPWPDWRWGIHDGRPPRIGLVVELVTRGRRRVVARVAPALGTRRVFSPRRRPRTPPFALDPNVHVEIVLFDGSTERDRIVLRADDFRTMLDRSEPSIRGTTRGADVVWRLEPPSPRRASP